MIVYCHEYLSDRWSYHPYVDHLRDLGFDLFTFDFRNHGESDSEPGTRRCSGRPTARFVICVRALEALAVAARSRSGRFRPFRRQPGRNDRSGRGRHRARRLGRRHRRRLSHPRDDGPLHQALVRHLCSQPDPAQSRCRVGLNMVAGRARRLTERRLNCRFPSVERPPARLAPRPWLMIHGESRLVHQPRDRQGLFDRGKELQGALAGAKAAKHNRCRETDPDGYAVRIAELS